MKPLDLCESIYPNGTMIQPINIMININTYNMFFKANTYKGIVYSHTNILFLTIHLTSFIHLELFIENLIRNLNSNLLINIYGNLK